MLMGDRAKWLLNFTENNNPQFIIDESHNIATNDTNRGKVIDYITNKSNRPIIRASATWSKNAKNIARCHDMFPTDYNEETLKKMVQRGGTALQEVLSNTLIAEGAMVRREHNFGKRQVNIIQSHETQRNRKATDAMATIMQKASHYTKRQFEIYKSAYINSESAQDAVERTSNIEQFSFSSSFSLIADGFTNAMRSSAAAQVALDAVSKKQKPIIGIDKTAESSLEFLFNAVRKKGADNVVLEEFPDFKAMMQRWIEKQGTREYKIAIEPTLAEMRKAQRNGTVAEPTVEKHQVTWREEMEKGTVEYQELESLEKDLIKSLETLPDLPLSPIDYVKTELAKHEISTAEVSGRKLHVRLHEDGRRYVIEPREKETKAEAQFAFNSNEKEAIILTKAGTEGISLHAAESLSKYGSEALNQRHVILMGSFMNIVDEEQFFGRGERKGQVAKAESSKVITGMPIEARMLAQAKEIVLGYQHQQLAMLNP
uniref:strawberry notch C-terminal domain-containing protein n=1 Tax=Candidatus Enterovibrio escicola TaxID=1927127 RepID=UPI001237CF93|nr:strawberry notch C-terminal domain-containing protein [Candidatus Enterovibrio escacola]